MTRSEVEDAILKLLQSKLPSAVVESMGPQDPKFYDVRPGGSVRVFYTESGPRAGQERNSNMHAEDWAWTVVVIAKDYRSGTSGNIDALGMLESGIAALSGQNIGTGRLLRRGDQLYPVPAKSGLSAYAATYTINAFVPRA